MKKLIYILMSFMLIFVIASCDEKTPVTYDPIESKTMTLYVGQTGQFDEGYSYSTLDSEVIELQGNSYRTVKEGSAVVTVKKEDSVLGVYLIAVYGSEPIVLKELKIEKKPASMTVTDTVKLEYTKEPVNANDYEALVWTSSNEEVAKVDKYGNVTALKMGEATITLTAVNTNVKQEVSITVVPRDTVFELNYDSIVGVSGAVEQILVADVLSDYEFDGNVTWFSENESVVTVSQDGTTTFVAPGTTNVGIKAKIDNKDISYKCKVTVLKDFGYKVIRTPEELQAIGNTSGNYMLGNDIDMTEAVSKGGALYNDGKGFMPLFEDAANSFKGVFDGNGYSIINMYINRPNDTFIAFMRYISAEEGKEGIIKRLSFVGGEISGGNYTSVFYANASGYGSVKSGVRDSYVNMKLTSVGSLSGLVGNNKGLVENCISNIEYDALGNVYLFALNNTGLEEGLGIKNCVFIGDGADKEFANLTNGGFVEGCSKITKDQISTFEFNMGNNWTWTKGSLPVVKGE